MHLILAFSLYESESLSIGILKGTYLIQYCWAAFPREFLANSEFLHMTSLPNHLLRGGDFPWPQIVVSVVNQWIVSLEIISPKMNNIQRVYSSKWLGFRHGLPACEMTHSYVLQTHKRFLGHIDQMIVAKDGGTPKSCNNWIPNVIEYIKHL